MFACRSYYFGDISPKHHPNYYISLIQECISYYRYSVLSDSTKPHPLIVNTCGWVSGELNSLIFYEGTAELEC